MFFGFLTILQVLQCAFPIFHAFQCFSPYSRSYHDFLIFPFCQFFWHIQGPTLRVSHFPLVTGFSPYCRSYCEHFSFFKFLSASLRIPGHTVFVYHFPRFFSFLATFLVLHCLFLLFIVFQCFLPYSMSYRMCFSFRTFFIVSCHISCPTMWVSLFPHVSVFSPYFSSYRVCVSFYTFFSVSHHIPGHTVFLSHFPIFSVFWPQSWS